MKRTPLRRGTSRLKRTPLAQVGARAKREAPARRAAVQAAKERSTICPCADRIDQTPPTGDPIVDRELGEWLKACWALRHQPATDPHEPGGRARDIGSHLDSDRIEMIHRTCHSYAHDHPKAARMIGMYS